MTEKILSLNPRNIGWKPLLHQVLERDGVEAVVLVVRIDDCWHSCWSNETSAGKAMAAMKLFNDVLNEIHADGDE